MLNTICVENSNPTRKNRIMVYLALVGFGFAGLFAGVLIGYIGRIVYLAIIPSVPESDPPYHAISQPLAVEPKQNIDDPVDILAFGDLMLDRNVREKINQYGAEYPFIPVEKFLTGHDIVVANAEGAFTSYQSQTVGVPNAPLVFTFDPATLPTLKKLGFTLLSQANNHSYNFGAEGLKQSEDYIDAAGLNWFGDPLNQNVGPYVVTIKGQKIAFIGYHQFVPGGFDNVLNAITSAKQQGAFVIVYPHWGIEYNEEMTQDPNRRCASVY